MREMQLRVAADLISKGLTNKTVAEQLKFASVTHFCREFKRYFGTTPRDYFMKMSRLEHQFQLSDRPDGPDSHSQAKIESRDAFTFQSLEEIRSCRRSCAMV